MKLMKSIIHQVKRIRMMQAVAAVLVLCMGLADVSMYMYSIRSEEDNSDYYRVITEEHEMDTALADGNYEDKNSDVENYIADSVETASEKKLFNILEILPTERKGCVGYTIGGCEPFTKVDGSEIKPVRKGGVVIADKAQMKEAYMDACLNPTPGRAYNGDAPNSDNLLDHNSLSNLFKQGLMGAFGDGGMAPFKLTTNGTYSGHYKYVGGNNGVYRNESADKNVAIMTSRFYDSGHDDYNYIFVYNARSVDEDDINVENEARIQYVNNEKFIKEGMGLSGSDVQKFKDEHDIEVVTKTPVSVSYDDIERADVIILNNADSSTMRYYSYALQIYNTLHGVEDINTDSDATFYNSNDRSKNVDFDTFEKVIKIYERVVVRQDVAFIGSRTNISGFTFDTNVRKLMCMLFYVHMKTGEIDYGSWKKEVLDPYYGSGRDLFMNFLKRYVDEPGTESFTSPSTIR